MIHAGAHLEVTNATTGVGRRRRDAPSGPRADQTGGTQSRHFAELHMNLLSRRVSADLPSRPYHTRGPVATQTKRSPGELETDNHPACRELVVENRESGSSLLGREFRRGPPRSVSSTGARA